MCVKSWTLNLLLLLISAAAAAAEEEGQCSLESNPSDCGGGDNSDHVDELESDYSVSEASKKYREFPERWRGYLDKIRYLKQSKCLFFTY